MIPESHQDRSVRLYEATAFPHEWALSARLLTGQSFADTSVLRHADRWWLFTATSPGDRHDTLRLYSAEELGGPWLEHPRSPIVSGNPHTARPAGRVIAAGDKLFRFTQDCYPVYGLEVRAFEITELTTTAYREQEASDSPLLKAAGVGWNASGMHHVDLHQIGRRVGARASTAGSAFDSPSENRLA